MPNPKQFWRLARSAIPQAVTFDRECDLAHPPGLILKLRPKHGIVLAHWDANEQLGVVNALGVVVKLKPDASGAQILWRPADISLRPSPAGRRYWAQVEPFFGFAKDVAARYMLENLFAEHFPEYSEIEFGTIPAQKSPSSVGFGTAIPGFVYVIKSPYGYKIGKTVNMKDRTRLFGVKLPFPISIEHYAFFDDYSQAESEFHRIFHTKRLEGEWFDLNAQDLVQIKSKGKHIPVAGL
jgi:hypothetical protein